MNNIQKLIDDLKLRKEKAQSIIDTYWDRTEVEIARHKGALQAFSLCIKKLKLILKEETAKDLPDEKKVCINHEMITAPGLGEYCKICGYGLDDL